MAADALGLHNDLRTAALAAFDRRGRGFTDDDKVGLCKPRDLAGGDALEAFLMDGAGDADLAGEVLAGLFRVAGGCRDHGAVAALHVGGAAAVDPAVDDLAAERVVLPLRRVDHVDGVDVAVHQDRLAGAFAACQRENAASAAVLRGIAHFGQGLFHQRFGLRQIKAHLGVAVQGAPPFAQLGLQLFCGAEQFFRCDHFKINSLLFCKENPLGHWP